MNEQQQAQPAQEALARLREMVGADTDAVRPGEPPKACQGDREYEDLKQALIDHFHPANPVEQLLVERIAVLDWRLKRSLMAERKSLHSYPGQEFSLPPAGALERILSYERTMDQELHRAITAFENLRVPSDTRTTRKTEKPQNEPKTPPFHAQETSHPDFKSDTPDFKMKSRDSIIDTPVEAMIEALFPSAARIKLLSILLLESPGRFYLRELAAKTGLWFRPVQRELAKLASVGIVIKEVNGQQTYYRINQRCPLAPELFSMFAKSRNDQPGTRNGDA